MSQAAPVSRRRIRQYAALIVIAGTLAYANSVSNPFVLDDRTAILDNPQIRTLWPPSVPLSPPDESPVARRPLVNLSFAVNYAIDGVNVRGYHIGNLTLHLLAALALFGLVRRTLSLERLAGEFGARAAALALAAAMIWMLHPLHTEIVNYISQRTAAMMGLLYLLTLYCSVRGLDPNASRWRGAAIAACAAGMAAKETMVTAPLVVVLFDRTFAFGSFIEAFRRRRRFYAGLAATWILLAVLMATGGRSTVGFDAGTTAWTYFLNQLSILTDYLRLVVWPRALVVDYGVPQPLTLGEVMWPALLVGTLLAAAVAAWRLRPHAGFLAIAAFVTIAPTSSVVPIVTEVGAERRLYLPLAAIVVLAVCLSWRAGSTLLSRVRQARPDARVPAWFAPSVLSTMCALLAAGTVLRNHEYRSIEALARATVERRPHGRAYFTLEDAVFRAGDRQGAIRYFRRATEDFPGARFALANEYLLDGDYAATIREARSFIGLAPDHPAISSARLLIATAHYATGDLTRALDEVRLVLDDDPASPGAHALLGQLLLAQGQPAAAIPHLERALSRLPRDVSTMRTLGSALMMTGDLSRAITTLERAVTASPGDAITHDLLGVAFAQQGRIGRAIQAFEVATQLDPDYTPARDNLARAQQIVSGSS